MRVVSVVDQFVSVGNGRDILRFDVEMRCRLVFGYLVARCLCGWVLAIRKAKRGW